MCRFISLMLLLQFCFYSCDNLSDLFHDDDQFTGIDLLSEEESEMVDHIVFEYLENYRYISVGLIREGQLVLTRSYGQDRIGKTDEYASVTKPVTAVVILQLYENGLIEDLDDPIGDYSEKYHDVMPEEYKDTPVTFRHLLCHQSGVPHHSRIWENGKLKLEFRPGTDVMYSTRGYGILGDVMSEITGLSYEDLVKTYIGKPVGATSFSAPNWLFEAPGGLVSSTISDMGLFACGIIQNTYLEDTTQVNIAWKPYGNDNVGAIGLGFYVNNYQTDSLAVYHAGSNGAPRAFMAIRPRQKIAVVLMGKHHDSDGPQFFYALSYDLIHFLDGYDE